MSEAYLIGNLLGRLVMSYALVWIVLLVASRLDWRLAFRRTRRWWGILIIALVFLAGVFASTAGKRGF